MKNNFTYNIISERSVFDYPLHDISVCLKGKSVLVTGAGGSIGSELCRRIAELMPSKLIIFDICENGVMNLYDELYRKNDVSFADIEIGSVCDRDRTEKIFEKYKPDVIYHAAAHKHVFLMEKNAGEAVKNNISGTLNLLECAKKYSSSKFVLISTDKAVNPTNVYGATKRVCEMLVDCYNTLFGAQYATVRFGNVIATEGSVIPRFENQIGLGGPVFVTHPDADRYFMTAGEAAMLTLAAGSLLGKGRYVLDMGTPVNILSLAEKIINYHGLEPYKDIEIRFTGLKQGEKLHEELFLQSETVRNTDVDGILSVSEERNLSDVFLSSVKKLVQIVNADNDTIKKALGEIVPEYYRY